MPSASVEVAPATSMAHSPSPLPVTRRTDVVVHFYNQRGTPEQWIKEGKEATHWTCLSRHRFRANEVRLLLGAGC
jgi:hypothetical protein